MAGEPQRPPVPPVHRARRSGRIIRGRATASATRSTWSGSPRRADAAGQRQPHADRRRDGHDRHRRRRAGRGRRDGRRGVLPRPARSVVGVELRGRLRPWVAAKDIILRAAEHPDDPRQRRGAWWSTSAPGVATLAVPGAGHLHQHGRRTGRHGQHLPGRRAHAAVPRGPGPGRAVRPAGGRRGAPATTASPSACTPSETRAPSTTSAGMHRRDVSAPAADEGGGRAPSATSSSTCRSWSRWPAAPPSPDNIARVADLAGTKVGQVVIGSCTNSSFQDLMLVAAMLKGRRVHRASSWAFPPAAGRCYHAGRQRVRWPIWCAPVRAFWSPRAGRASGGLLARPRGPSACGPSTATSPAAAARGGQGIPGLARDGRRGRH